ncbi:para-nitrobenzyl esterase-like [Colias croceus]|uniref:para-nitrobenzyl esterase-like n=1 Tax=Colias crocea TaxID=72248 RepID=UPI001E28174C|nr:para-nitrobenzyl esterase-like [Colias croceus]
MKNLFLFIAIGVVGQNYAEDSSLIVNINQGPVKGYKLSGWDLFEFHGIPYATAPTGEDRFKAPLEAPTWTDTFEAVETNVICPQNGNSLKGVVDPKVRENCLIANLYVPDTDKTSLPVVVYVHGGAYQYGFSDIFSARNVVQSKEIIVVTFNYRVGVHGFLCLGTETAPGNAGMKDQVALLRWVQENIEYFGGNPADVTIYGSSAGARSVDLLSISEMTEGLFIKMVADSGITLGPSTVQVDPIRSAKSFAKLLNYTGSYDISSLEEFYTNATYDLLVSIDTARLVDFFFSPCIEQDIGLEMFLSESPYQMLKSGNYRQVPSMYSFCEFEGSFRLRVFEQWKNILIKNLTDFLPLDLDFPTDEERSDVLQKVKDYYFGDEEVISNENILLFINYFTDTMYVYPMLRAIKLHLAAGHENLYLYQYSFTTEESSVFPYINKRGAFHTVQSFVILDNKNETTISTELKNMKTIMRNMWYNFITTGEPTLEGSVAQDWPAAQLDDIKLMSFNQTIELKSLEHRALFWEDIYDQYYKDPIPPTTDCEE